DDEELVEPALFEERLDLGGHAAGVARPHAPALDHGVGAERALVVAAAFGLQVRHAPALEVEPVVDPAPLGAEHVERRQPGGRRDRHGPGAPVPEGHPPRPRASAPTARRARRSGRATSPSPTTPYGTSSAGR